MLDLKKMRKEWKYKDFADEEIAKLIGLETLTLQRKCRGEGNQDLSATSAYIICEKLGSPLDMFIVKEKADDAHD